MKNKALTILLALVFAISLSALAALVVTSEVRDARASIPAEPQLEQVIVPTTQDASGTFVIDVEGLENGGFCGFDNPPGICSPES